MVSSQGDVVEEGVEVRLSQFRPRRRGTLLLRLRNRNRRRSPHTRTYMVYTNRH